MLYCQPAEFYSEMKFISDNYSTFMHLLDLSAFNIEPDISHIDPVKYLISMFNAEKDNPEPNKIFALRTFGVYNALTQSASDVEMQIYFAKASNGSFFVSYPSVARIGILDSGETYFENSDEYGDVYQFTLNDIAYDSYKNPYSISSYIKYDREMFEPRNLLAKIPINLIQTLV